MGHSNPTMVPEIKANRYFEPTSYIFDKTYQIVTASV